MELPEIWQRVTALLSSALALERERIGSDETGVVQDFLDQNELALAYDQLIDALDERDREPHDETRRLLGEAGRLMDHRRSPVIKEIEALEARLRAAILTRDIAELDRLIANAAIYIDQNGRRIDKNADLAAYRSGLTVERFDLLDEPIIRRLGETAIVNFFASVAGRYGVSTFAARLAYTRVWHKRDGVWRVEWAHSSKLADAPGNS